MTANQFNPSGALLKAVLLGELHAVVQQPVLCHVTTASGSCSLGGSHTFEMEDPTILKPRPSMTACCLMPSKSANPTWERRLAAAPPWSSCIQVISADGIVSYCAGGAADMQGVSPNADNSIYSIPIEAAPSTRQGFGRVALGLSLPLAGSNFQLQVEGRAPGTHCSARCIALSCMLCYVRSKRGQGYEGGDETGLYRLSMGRCSPRWVPASSSASVDSLGP